MADQEPAGGLLTTGEYEAEARRRLPADVWDYLAGGSGSESALAANRAAFARRALRPRALVDVSRVDTSLDLLGLSLPAPVAVAPTAFQRLFHPDGECATARGAADAGLLCVTATLASRTLEEAAAAGPGPRWFQLYWLRQREVVADLVTRAEAAGYRAIVLTVDAPRIARRLRDVRNGFALPPDVVPANLAAPVTAGLDQGRAGESALARHASNQFDQSISWQDLAWLRAQTRLPVVLKGVLTAEDAALAVDHGVEAVVVSNHGGRQLDRARASLDALPEVVDAVAGRCPVLVDGGFRTGAEILMALALGARAVLVGRPVLWGLATAGADGVRAVLDLLVAELEEAMALTGRPRLADLGPDAVGP